MDCPEVLGVIRFDAVIEEAPRGGAVVEIPTQVVEELGGGGRIPVRATFDGVDYRGSIVTYSGRQIIGILKAIRDDLGKGPGDSVIVAVERDASDRRVEIPAELAEAFELAPGAREAFAALSYSHQRQHVDHITDAKKPETRKRRALQTVETLVTAT